MKMMIKKMEFENFKCYKHKVIDLTERTNVKGSNGIGKTTIADGFYWVMANANTRMESNPAVFPLGVEEATPSVTIDMEIDGRPVKVARKVKRSVKKSRTGEADAVSYSSTYEVNSVEYGLRDFTAKMNEYGVELDKVLLLGHPESFVAKKPAEIRSILFDMAGKYTEAELASMTEGASEVAELAKNYSLEEIAAMQKSTLRKINEVYGKNGEIVNAKIEALELAKVDMDVSAIELAKADAQRRLNENADKQIDIQIAIDKNTEISNEIMNLKFQLSDMVRNAETTLANSKGNKLEEIRSAKRDYEAKQREKLTYLAEADRTNIRINSNKSRVDEIRNVYDKLKKEEFDSSKAVCPVCKREYEADKVQSIKEIFEKDKERRLEDIKNEGNSLVEQNKADKAAITTLNKQIDSVRAEMDELDVKIHALENELAAFPDATDVTDSEAYKAIEKLCKAKEEELNKNDINEIRSVLRNEEMTLHDEIEEYVKQLAKFSRNNDLDEQIADLQMKRMEYEQEKADAERILYELDLVSRKSNELFTADINKHFKVVNWKFFDYQKNGNYTNCAEAYVGDRKLGESMNTALEIKAKLDICEGLSEFMDQKYPVFLDGAECLDTANTNAIESSLQLILLAVSDDKELVIS